IRWAHRTARGEAALTCLSWTRNGKGPEVCCPPGPRASAAHGGLVLVTGDDPPLDASSGHHRAPLPFGLVANPPHAAPHLPPRLRLVVVERNPTGLHAGLHFHVTPPPWAGAVTAGLTPHPGAAVPSADLPARAGGVTARPAKKPTAVGGISR